MSLINEMNICRFLAIFFLIAPLSPALTSCAAGGRGEAVKRPEVPAAQNEKGHSVRVWPLETGQEAGREGVELSWKVPDFAVEGFIIHFGYSEDALIHEIFIRESDLIPFNDAIDGLVYRYLIEDTDENRDLYLAISAYTGRSVSPISEVIIVKAVD